MLIASHWRASVSLTCFTYLVAFVLFSESVWRKPAARFVPYRNRPTSEPEGFPDCREGNRSPKNSEIPSGKRELTRRAGRRGKAEGRAGEPRQRRVGCILSGDNFFHSYILLFSSTYLLLLIGENVPGHSYRCAENVPGHRKKNPFDDQHIYVYICSIRNRSLYDHRTHQCPP